MGEPAEISSTEGPVPVKAHLKENSGVKWIWDMFDTNNSTLTLLELNNSNS